MPNDDFAKQMQQFDGVAFAFQGGGALGAYQVGIFKALTEAGYKPDLVVGTSIGAINAAIIVGNKPENQLKRLQEFWSLVSRSNLPVPLAEHNIYWWRFQNVLSARLALLFGIPGFFTPNPINPFWVYGSSPDQISFYKTAPLRETLLRLVDFDIINSKKTRLFLGTVNVEKGRAMHFDNFKQEITVDHILASGALPPGFPAIKIDDKFYWDGGVSSNTPMRQILTEVPNKKYLCFMVHLFDAEGPFPVSLDEVEKRRKDIMYASHFSESLQNYKEIHDLRSALLEVLDKLPPEVKEESRYKVIAEAKYPCYLGLVRFQIKPHPSQMASKDYEFSLRSIQTYMKQGEEDVARAIKKSPWLLPVTDGSAVTMYDMTKK